MNDETNQIKAGKTKAGTQKYKCKKCGKNYAQESKKRGHSEKIKRQAIKLYLEGNSGRQSSEFWESGKICACIGFGNMRKILSPKRRTSCTASSREKNKFYAVTLVSRDTREIVGFDIAFDKSRERIQRLVDRSVKARQYYSDAYSAYVEVRYEGDHAC